MPRALKLILYEAKDEETLEKQLEGNRTPDGEGRGGNLVDGTHHRMTTIHIKTLTGAWDIAVALAKLDEHVGVTLP